MVKTDRKDARGLAQLIRMGWFRPVHAKSMSSQEVRALLVARKQLLGLARITRFSKLKRWGIDVAKRRGSKRAKVALARKIAVILHRMWVDGTTYRWTDAQPIAVQV